MAELKEPPPPVDRSKYADVFAELQAGKHDGRWLLLDVTRGGGLASRLKAGKYVGLAGLTYEIEQHRIGDGALEVYIRITGREESDDDG